MAVKFNLVKELIRKDVINTNQLIINSIFGNVLPDQYDENKTYEKGSVIIRVNEDGVYELLVSTKDNVTGEFSEEDWEKVSFTDLFKDSSVITQNNIVINNIQEGMADDLATLVYNLAGLIDNTNFNMIFRENYVKKIMAFIFFQNSIINPSYFLISKLNTVIIFFIYRYNFILSIL